MKFVRCVGEGKIALTREVAYVAERISEESGDHSRPGCGMTEQFLAQGGVTNSGDGRQGLCVAGRCLH
jgi:hypothetical protein